MTVPEFDRHGPPGELILKCPCGSTYTHHGAVEVWTRREDAPEASVTHLALSGAVTLEARSADGCPSPRRGGLTIEMECEECHKTRRLAVYQHKGETYMRWLEAPR